MGDIYNPQNFVISKSVFRQISRVKTEAMAALDEAYASDPEVAALEVSAAQYVIIATLAEQEANSSAQLCKSFSYDAGAMTRMVDRLEAKGLLARRRCTDDRRLVNLELTEAGKAIFPKLKLLAMEVQNRFLRGFSEAEVQALQEFLCRILKNA
jgi:DNA-binding MarR family transcriptional regulator